MSRVTPIDQARAIQDERTQALLRLFDGWRLQHEVTAFDLMKMLPQVLGEALSGIDPAEVEMAKEVLASTSKEAWGVAAFIQLLKGYERIQN